MTPGSAPIIPLPPHNAFKVVGEAADALGQSAYVVGGYVRDLLLGRPSKDIDFVTVGSGIALAKEVSARLGNKAGKVHVYRAFGTAQVVTRDGLELEFVGARRESYNHDSRNPIVEDGTLNDDISRRDFTVNALAISLNAGSRGELVDLFGGVADLNAGILRTPLDPDITFSDDPLRMLRAIRFASQLGFEIHPATFEAIRRNVDRIKIITAERVATELQKIMRSPKPSVGLLLLSDSGLMTHILPELQALRGVEVVKGRAHKDNFFHTLTVTDRVAQSEAGRQNEWLRWAALLHDIAKPVTKRWDDSLGWTFHNHNFIGAKMVPAIFRRLKLPLDERMRYVAKLVELHMRPIALVEDEVTDSAVRRLLFDAGDDIDDLMTLCRADITSKNEAKVRRYLDNFDLVARKMTDLNERDRIRNFQPPVDGNEIMAAFGLSPSSPVEMLKKVGILKQAVKDAILDGIIPNEHEAARKYMIDHAQTLGFGPNPSSNNETC